MQTNRIDQLSVPTNTILHGDCISIMHSLPANSIDFILTDPPYLVRYKDREGRSIQNDSNSDWLEPAFSEAYRVLKQDHFMISFLRLDAGRQVLPRLAQCRISYRWSSGLPQAVCIEIALP
jgi:DNA modification methylase